MEGQDDHVSWSHWIHRQDHEATEYIDKINDGPFVPSKIALTTYDVPGHYIQRRKRSGLQKTRHLFLRMQNWGICCTNDLDNIII